MEWKKFLVPAIVVVVIIILVIILNPFTIVNATERGLKFTLGAIEPNILEPGMRSKIPFIQEIKTISIQPRQISKVIPVGTEGIITKDNQTIGVSLQVFYKYKSDELVVLYKDVGIEKMEQIIASSLIEVIKITIGQYDIFTVPASQEEIRSKAFVMLKDKLHLYPMELTELKITNYDWSDSFDKQIEATMQEAQKVKQKEQELMVTQYEAQKRVKEAEADKESAKLRAEAKALEGEGIKKYNDAIAVNWNIELKKMELEIEKIKAEKWNGQYVANNNYMPIPFNYGIVQK